MNRELPNIRADISAVDHEILALLEQRMKLAGEVARYKMAHGLPVLDVAREAEILTRYAREVSFDVRAIFQAIMDESKRIQQHIISGDNP